MSARDIEDVYELSPLQQGMVYHSLSAPDTEMYVAQRTYRLHGRLDLAAIEAAWRDVIARHPALRTAFVWDTLDKPLQVVHRTVPTNLACYDWRDVDPGERDARLAQSLADDRQAGFTLTQPPLMRMYLVRYSDEEYRFVWTHHMVALDGWSVPLVTGEVFKRYAMITGGVPGDLPAAPPYGAYIDWLQRQDPAAAEAFWRRTFEGWAGPALLGDGSGPVGSIDVAELAVDIPAGLSADLQEMAAGSRVTVNTIMQAAWALLVSRYAGNGDVMFGMTTSGRPADLPGAEAMVGLLINTLPSRLRVPEDTPVRTWLAQVQRSQAQMREYEHTPLSSIRQWTGVPANRPLFDSVVVFENYPVGDAVTQGLGDMRISQEGGGFEKTSEPLTLVASAGARVAARLLYHRHRFGDARMERMAAGLLAILRQFAAHPEGRTGDVTALGRDEHDLIVRGWNRTAIEYPGAQTVHELIAAQTARTPHAVAVSSETGSLSYAELDHRASQLACYLRDRGVGPDVRVGVCAERSTELVVALLGVLKAGGAYVPLEPSYPAARLALMISDASVAIVLTQQRHRAALPPDVLAVALDTEWEQIATRPSRDPRNVVTGRGLAYVMYTSGSTGRPKGVMISHAAIRNRLLWMQEHYRLGPDDRVLQKTPFSFDVSVWEFFWPLLAGACLIMARPDGHRDPAYLVQAITRHGVTTIHFVPSMLRMFLDEPGVAGCTSLRRVFCSGEALPAALVTRWAGESAAPVHNLYGPTEAAVDVTYHRCGLDEPGGAGGIVPIGRPVANTRLYVLDQALRPAPLGTPGELCIAGVQVARGYLNRPELSAERFTASPFLGEDRVYRTGDLARYAGDGTIEFLGRLDHQLKVRGLRVEPGEIEAALRGHPAVGEAVVAAAGTDGAADRLVAYLLTGDPVSEETLRAHLRAQLPAQLVPGDFVWLDEFPLTPSGKVDRAALAARHPGTRHGGAGEYVPPATDTEAALAETFAEVLAIGQVGADTNFFDSGGDSFAAIRAIRAIRKFAAVSVSDLFLHPTPRSLGSHLAQAREQHQATSPLLRLTPPDRAAAVTLICVPYGGGNAVAYYPLARALPEHIALQAVALPGHDFGAEAPLAELPEIARACAEEIERTVNGPVAIYGHCIGVALATELARRLEQAGRPVSRVFLAGSYPFPKRKVLGLDIAKVIPFERWETDTRTMRYLQSLGGFEEVIEPDELAFVMRNFRHDGSCAKRYFTARYEEREPDMLKAPITFVAGGCDPETPNFRRRYKEWDRFSPVTGLAVVEGGRHYFLKHNARELAKIIDQTLSESKGTGSKDALLDAARS